MTKFLKDTFAAAARWPALLYVPHLVGMTVSALLDPPMAGRIGVERYGHNHHDDLLQALLCGVGELAFVSFALGRDAAAVGRAVLSLTVVAPWALLWVALTQHGGDVVLLHALWLTILTVALLTTTSIRTARWLALRRPSKGHAKPQR